MKKSHSFQTNHAVEAYSASRDLWDTPIFESHSFVALPTVGALVEGWLLVVPREPVLSFSQLPTSLFPELEVFLDEVVSAVQSTYGPVSVFEHGPSCNASTVGCGVDYAHLHLVPVHCDLLAGAQQIAPNIRWTEARSIKEIHQHAASVGGYWFVQQTYESGHCHVGTCPYGKPTSQLFRRVIANHLGCPSTYDWKRDLGETMIAATVEKLTKLVIFA